MKGIPLIDQVHNEITLLWYSLRMLIGRNLLAVGFISVVILGVVFTDPVSVRQTRLAILLKQLELFAPLLGIVIFSDLIAGDVQAKRATLLQCSRAGIVPVVEALLGKGAALGTVLAFMMSVIALSLPEMVILRKVLKPQLIAAFVGIVGGAIVLTGYLFNLVI